MSDFILVLIVCAFVFIFLLDWLYKKLDRNADDREERRLMNEIRRNAQEQEDKNN